MGSGQNPSRQTIWCMFESKRAALVATILCGVSLNNICFFSLFSAQKNNIKKLCPKLSHDYIQVSC